MILKTIASIILICTCLPAISQCTPEQSIQLQQTWRKFVLATATADPKKVAPFFKFPMRLMGYDKEDKATVISELFFHKNYKLMFDDQVPGNSDFYAEFYLVKKLPDEKILEESKQRNCVGVNGSLPKISIGMFRLYWNVNTGWLIHDVYYSHFDKENLFYNIKHP